MSRLPRENTPVLVIISSLGQVTSIQDILQLIDLGVQSMDTLVLDMMLSPQSGDEIIQGAVRERLCRPGRCPRDPGHLDPDGLNRIVDITARTGPE